MVNSKKISKQSIAIIALSVLLVLSMIISLSGAWFSDKESGSDSTNGTFATVDITDTDLVIGEWGNPTTILPGDSVGITAAFASVSDVDVYVRVSNTVSVVLLGSDGEYGTVDDIILLGNLAVTATYDGGADSEEIKTNVEGKTLEDYLTLATQLETSDQRVVESYTDFFLLPVATEATPVDITATVGLGTQLPNALDVTIGESTVHVVFNHGGDVQINVSMVYAAVQVGNMGTAADAYTYLGTLLA